MRESCTPGRDFIGVGVGVMVFDRHGHVFMAQRGEGARNEVGFWEFPGGAVEFGELMEEAACREIREEHGFEVEVTGSLGAFDHLIPGEGQHWISVTYVARIVAGDPVIREPSKCSDIGWFALDSLPAPMSPVSRAGAERAAVPGFAGAGLPRR